MKEKAALTFEQAKIKAESYVQHKDKLLGLLEKATRKSARCYEFLLAPWESLQIFLRLLRAQLAGKFCAPADAILMIVAGVIYFVSPFDLIPDSIPVLGLTDDTSVLIWAGGQPSFVVEGCRTLCDFQRVRSSSFFSLAHSTRSMPANPFGLLS